MAHLTFQLGAALTVPFEPPRRMKINPYRWRSRAWRAAKAAALNSRATGWSLPRSPVWLRPPPTRTPPAPGRGPDRKI